MINTVVFESSDMFTEFGGVSVFTEINLTLLSSLQVYTC